MRAAPVLAAMTMLLVSCTDADVVSPPSEEQSSPAEMVQTKPLPPKPLHFKPPRRHRMQSASEALAMDQALVAAQTGRSLREVRALGRLSGRFGRIRAKLSRQRPELFAGSLLADPPRLYIKGEADEFVRGVIADAGFPIKLVEGMPYSWRELERRSMRLADALSALGYRSYGTSFDEKKGQLEATVRRVRGLPSTPSELRAALPAGLGRGAQLTVIDHAVGQDF